TRSRLLFQSHVLAQVLRGLRQRIGNRNRHGIRVDRRLADLREYQRLDGAVYAWREEHDVVARGRVAAQLDNHPALLEALDPESGHLRGLFRGVLEHSTPPITPYEERVENFECTRVRFVEVVHAVDSRLQRGDVRIDFLRRNGLQMRAIHAYFVLGRRVLGHEEERGQDDADAHCHHVPVQWQLDGALGQLLW